MHDRRADATGRGNGLGAGAEVALLCRVLATPFPAQSGPNLAPHRVSVLIRFPSYFTAHPFHNTRRCPGGKECCAPSKIRHLIYPQRRNSP